jgi:hypothetical protein
MLAKLAAPVVFMTSEVCMCWYTSFMKARFENYPMNEDGRCMGVDLGVTPLVFLLPLLSWWPAVLVGDGATITLENICKFRLGKVETVQIVYFGAYSVYALGYYAMRRERTFEYNGLEMSIASAFGFTLIICAAAGVSKTTKGEVARGLLKDGRGSRSSIEDRVSVGIRKSLWDGGTKGAMVGKKVPKRGSSVEVGKGDGEGNAAFDPGMF